MSVVNKPGKDGIVLDEEMMNNMAPELDPKDFPKSEDILNQVIKIQEKMLEDNLIKLNKEDEEKYKDKMFELFPNFQKKYPSLFNLIIRGDDPTMLTTILTGMDSVREGKQSLDSLKTNLEDTLANKFLYPSLNKKQADSVRNKLNELRKK